MKIFEFVNRPAGAYGLGGTPITPEDLLLIRDGDIVGITPGQAAAIELNTAKETNATHTGDVTGSEALTIANGAVTGPKIASSAISTAKIQDGAVTEDKIFDQAVTEEKIKNKAVTETKIADNAVTETKIADNAVTAAKVANHNLGNSKLAQVATNTFKGRVSPSNGEVQDLTVPQVKTVLGIDALEEEVESKVDDEDLQPVSPQFGVSTASQLVLVSKWIYLAKTASQVAFNLNYVIGDFGDPSESADIAIDVVSAKPQNICVVYSKSAVVPSVLSDSRVIFPGNNYDTDTDKLNVLTFTCLDSNHIFCENRVITLPLVIPTVSGYYGFARNSTDITVNFADCPVGDVMVVAMANLVGVGGTGHAYTKPAGWDTILEMSNGLDIWVRKRQLGDPDTFAFTVPSIVNGGGTIALSVTGSNYMNGSPGLVLQGATVEGSNTSTKTIPAVTLPKTSLCMVIFGIASNNSQFVSFTPGGWTEVGEDSRSGNRPLNMGIRTVDTTTGTVTATQSTGQNAAGIIIAFHS